MQILDNIIIISLIVAAFCLGMYIDSRYNRKAMLEQKDALERQFMRLRAKADADDPCKPYMAPRSYWTQPVQIPVQPVEQPIDQNFMEHLQKNGRASTKLRNSKGST